MNITVTQILKLLLITIAGAVGALILGLLKYGTDVFSLSTPGFIFVSYGLSGAIIFAFYHVRKLAEAITTAVVVSAIQFVPLSVYITMLRAIVFSFGLNIMVVALAFIFERKLASLHWAKFLVVAASFGAMLVLLTLIIELVGGASGLPASVFRDNFVDGVLLGLGLGLGVQAAEAFLHSLEPLPRKRGRAVSTHSPKVKTA